MSENETIRTSAKVRVMLTYAFNNFEVQTEIKNDSGLSDAEINTERKSIEALVKHAVEDYKGNPIISPKEELAKIDKRLAQIRDLVSQQKKEPDPTPEELEAIKNLPEYKPKAAVTKTKK